MSHLFSEIHHTGEINKIGENNSVSKLYFSEMTRGIPLHKEKKSRDGLTLCPLLTFGTTYLNQYDQPLFSL